MFLVGIYKISLCRPVGKILTVGSDQMRSLLKRGLLQWEAEEACGLTHRSAEISHQIT